MYREGRETDKEGDTSKEVAKEVERGRGRDTLQDSNLITSTVSTVQSSAVVYVTAVHACVSHSTVQNSATLCSQARLIEVKESR